MIMAPAMNSHMWDKPAVQRNVAQLRADGVLFDRSRGRLPELPHGGPGPHGLAGEDFPADRQALELVNK